MAVTVPAWFDYKVYRDNKIADLQAHNYNIDTFNFGEKFASAGYEDNEEGLYRHFCDYGMSENISPNALFDANYYFQAKAADYFGLGEAKINQVTAAQVQFIKDAFASAGMSAWQHYTKFGMKEGIDPSVYFDTDKYWDAKLLQLQAEQPEAGWTRDGMIDFFKSQNLNPVSHYCSFGEKEGLTYEASSRAGVRQDLTTDADNLVGTMGASTIDDNGNVDIGSIYNDYFNAEVVKQGNTLQSEDIINGLGGSDTLYARVDAQGPEGSIEPTVKDVETILFRSQIGDGDDSGYYDIESVRGDGDSYGNVGATIDADRISFKDETTRLYIGSDNSRADLTIEDLRHDSNVTTVRMADTDPGVDFYLYFDPQHLKGQQQGESGIIELELMDVKNAQLHEQPLTEQPFDKVSFGYRVNGKTQVVTFDLTASAKSNYTTEDATYDTLLTAFKDALAKFEAENPAMKGVFTVELGTQWTGYAHTGVHDYTSPMGRHIVISADEGVVFYDRADTNQGWGVSTGNVPLVGGIVWDVTEAQSIECPLIEVGIQLDNVGRVQWYDASECLPDDIIFGSNAGDLQVGSMALRGGVERMDVTVDRGSWLKGLYSTNDTLRMVTVTAEDINGDGKAGNVDANGELIEQGQLYIGSWTGKLDDEGNPPNNLTWTDPAKLLTAISDTDDGDAPTGLKDVAVFDAEDYQGQINIAAEITEDSYDKYLKSVDGVKLIDKWAPITGYGDKFTYLTGTNDDTVNMTVNGDIAADVDFKLNIDTGAGNDLVAFRYDDMSENQDFNQKQLRNVDINTGDGDDHVWFYSNDNDPGFYKSTAYIRRDDGVDVTIFHRKSDGSWADQGNDLLDEFTVKNDYTVVTLGGSETHSNYTTYNWVVKSKDYLNEDQPDITLSEYYADATYTDPTTKVIYTQSKGAHDNNKWIDANGNHLTSIVVKDGGKDVTYTWNAKNEQYEASDKSVGDITKSDNYDATDCYIDPNTGVKYTESGGKWVDEDGNQLTAMVVHGVTYTLNAKAQTYNVSADPLDSLDNLVDDRTHVDIYDLYYEPLDEGHGSVNIFTGDGKDVVYANQEEFWTGGAKEGIGETGVNDNAYDYNAVFVFNTRNTPNNDIDPYNNRVGVDGFDGATLNNDVESGYTSFSFNTGYFGSVTDARAAESLYVTVNFKGFTGRAELTGFSVSTDQNGNYFASLNGNTSVSAEAINHAFIRAVEDDTTAMHGHSLGDVLSAKDGAGHTLLIESLINGKMDLSDLSLGFELRDAKGNVIKDAKVFDHADMYTTTEYAYEDLNNPVTPYRNPYKGNDLSTDSQVVVNSGAGNDVIVLNNNGYLDSDADGDGNNVVQVKDVIALSGSFGNDVIFDFQHGVDKINVKGLGLDSLTKASSITNLKDDTLIVYNNSAKSQTDIQKLADDGKISFANDEDQGSLALVAVHSGMRYTLALASKATSDTDSADVNAQISVLGSLTFDNDTSTLTVDDFNMSNSLV